MASAVTASAGKADVDIEHNEKGRKLQESQDQSENRSTGKGRDDLGQQILAEHSDEPPPTPEELRKVRWRIDLFMMPLLIWIYMLQFLDKVSYGLGANFGVLQDLKLQVIHPDGTTDLTRFQHGSMIFWTGFIAGIYPLSFVAQRLKPSTSCSAYVIIWGSIFLCAPACKNWQGIFAQRFMLGFMESGVTPCFMILTAIFYTKGEQAARSAIWFSGCGWSQIIGYPIMYGVLKMDMAIPKWQAIYYLWGSFTVVFGIAFWFIIPNDQKGAYFLNSRQKFVAIERLRVNQAGIENPHFKWSQVKEAVTDFRLLIMIPLAFLSVIPNACVSTFSPIVLRGLGYSPLQTLIMTIPQGVCNVVPVIGVGLLQQRFRNIRAISFVAIMIPIIVCAALLWKLPLTNLSGRLAAVCLFPMFTSAFVTILALTVSNVSGHTKRSMANAMFLMGYSVGQVAAPLTYKATESPNFPSGFKATVVCLVLGIALMLVYTGSCYFENRRRDRLGEMAREDRAFLDITDKENLSFRYEL